MIIDAHNHPDWHGHNLERFLRNMQTCRIDKTWLLSCERPRDEHNHGANRCYPVVPDIGIPGPIPFSRCLSYAERAPERFILGYAPDPRRPEAIDQLQAAIEIYNVRIYGELKLRMMLDNLDAIEMYRFCGAHHLPVVVHIEYPPEDMRRHPRSTWYGGGIEPFENAVKACPDTVFLGHGPGFWAHISGDEQSRSHTYPEGKVAPGGKVIEMLAQYPNLYCDLCAGSGLKALQRDPAFAAEFLNTFQERVLYGRDCFSGAHQAFLNTLELPATAIDKIYAGNALKLVPIEAS